LDDLPSLLGRHGGRVGNEVAEADVADETPSLRREDEASEEASRVVAHEEHADDAPGALVIPPSTGRVDPDDRSRSTPTRKFERNPSAERMADDVRRLKSGRVHRGLGAVHERIEPRRAP
jgi:hypothetical protein